MVYLKYSQINKKTLFFPDISTYSLIGMPSALQCVEIV